MNSLSRTKKNLIKIAISAILILNLNTNLQSQNTLESSNLQKGAFEVGFKLTSLKDYTRTSIRTTNLINLNTENRARDIRIYEWYPAMKSDLAPLKLHDFFIKGIEDYGKTPGVSEAENLVYYAAQFNRIPRTRIEKILQKECAAIENAEPATGKFPVIIIGQGYGYESPISQLLLSEYLASHGYIVLTAPLIGSYSKKAEINMLDFEAQIRDLEFILSKVFTMSHADTENIATLGFDLGAMSAAMVQMRNTNIRALVTFDGGIMFKHNTSRLLNPSPYYDPQKLDVPALIFTRTVQNNIEMGLEEDSTIFLNSPYSHKFIVRTEDMKHHYYTSYPLLGVESLVSPPLAMKTYPIVCEFVLHFFNHFLKSDSEAIHFFKEDPARFQSDGVNLSIHELTSKIQPPNLKTLEYIFLNEGFEKGLQFYKKAINDGYTIAQDDLNTLAYTFLYDYGRAPDAISIFKIIISENPDSANAYDSLGEAYLFTADYPLALDNYKKSLELNPENATAKRIIPQLERILNN